MSTNLNDFSLKHKEALEPSNFTWFESELSGCDFKDVRLNKRFRNLTESLWQGRGESIPYACQDWANTKAAYRFFSNERVNEQEILKGHFESTHQRFIAASEPVLILHDTTEFSYQRANPADVGSTCVIPTGKDLFGKPKYYTKCGILMHSSLVVTTNGLPLGLAAIKFWTREKFKGTNELKKNINPTRISIDQKESYRWLENLEEATQRLTAPAQCIHIGDRESDIYELYSQANELGTNFVFRTCVDRCSGEGETTINRKMKQEKINGVHHLQVTDKRGKKCEVTLDIKYQYLKVLPPRSKQKHYPPLELTVIHAVEQQENPLDRERIVWKLITNLTIDSLGSAIEKLEWYAMRWKIETFHKILKSGCKAQETKLQTAERIVKLIAIYCILSWRIFWMTMLKRCEQAIPVEVALTEKEIKILDCLEKTKSFQPKNKTVSDYLVKISKLGGYLARTSDPEPGNIVIWRGLRRLTDIQLGFELASRDVGN